MHHLDSMKNAARAGGEVVRSYFGASLELTQKTILADVRTQADLDSEAAILTILERDFPQYNIISEERGNTNHNSEYTFVIDPLDGTHNFTLGIPVFSISIGLKKGSDIIAGVVYNVMLDELYSAEKGKGAFRNDEPIHVNQSQRIEDVTFSYVARYGVPKAEELAIFSACIESDMKRVLTQWSPALDFCLLASGRIEAILVSHSEIYDYMGGKIIALEAGAYCTDLQGGLEAHTDNNVFLITNNSKVHSSVYSTLSPAFQALV